MGTYDVFSEKGHTVVKKRHPLARGFLNGWLVAIALVLLLGITIQNPVLVVVFFGIVLVVWNAQRRKSKA